MRARGWIGIALLVAVILPAPVLGATSVTFSLGMSATTVKVGDSMTLTPNVGNDAPGTVLRCEIYIEHYEPPKNWVRMHVSSSGCEPWTFVVPPGPLGQYEVVARVFVGLQDGHPLEVVHAAPPAVTLASGGTPKPFVTNYPVQSWALDDLVSTPTPIYGEPLTIYPPATADACDMRILGGIDNSHVRQSGGCDAWTFTIPERDLQGPGTVFSQTTDVQVQSWIGESPYTLDPEAGFMGSKYGEAYAVNLADFAQGDGTGTGYTSNLPAIFGGLDRGHTGQSGENTTFALHPAVAGTSSGTCVYSAAPGTTPVVPGGCQDPIIVPAFLGTGTQVSGYRLELRNAANVLLSYSDVEVAWVDDMSTLQVSAPPEVDTGETTTIDAGTDTGAPSEYAVTAAPQAASAAAGDATSLSALSGESLAAAAPIVIASGSLDPSDLADGADIAVHHAFPAAGRYRVTATFTDVRGEKTSGSTVILVSGSDTTKPVTTAPKFGFVSGGTVSSGLVPTKFTWTGSDAGSGIARYHAAISKDGGTYSLISSSLSSASLTRNLTPGHSYRLRVRAVDKAGNVGVWVYGSTFTVRSYQETSSRITYTGTWKRPTSTGYWGSYERYATAAGAKASFTFTGKAYALIGCVGPARGSAKVYVNGVLVATISTYAATTSCKKVLYATTWSTAISRKVSIVVSGTSGHPRVDVDAVVTGG